MGDGIEKVVTFEEKVCAVAADLYPGGLPDPPAWFPVDVIQGLERQSRAAALLVRMVATDGTKPDSELGRVQWDLTFLWIGLETGDQERIDLSLDSLLGTSGRGWLANRLRELGLSLEHLHHELQVLCVELIRDFARAKARVDNGAAARGYFRNAFRNRLETWLKQRVSEREKTPEPIADLPEPAGIGGDSEIVLLAAIARAGLSDRESEALRHRLAGLEGQALAKALGVATATAETLSRRARKKIEDAL
jgi:DNA-directed RNA polymerase specialized sigma24 family protein